MIIGPRDRRRFLKDMGGMAAALAAVRVPGPLLVTLGRKPEPVPPIQDPRLKTLADAALEAARSAGATYADVRLSHTRIRGGEPGTGTIYGASLVVEDAEDMEVGVRALVAGYWGFASGPVWSAEEMARLGAEAAAQAKANALDGVRRVALAPAPKVPDGHWTMPVERDPFEVSPLEVEDFLVGMVEYAITRPGVFGGVGTDFTFFTQAKLLATSDGSYCSQQTYRAEGSCNFNVGVPQNGGAQELTGLTCLGPAGMGFELWTADHIPQVRDHTIYEEIARLVERTRENLMLPVKPVPIGRYDAVFDAASVQGLAAETLGRATELDRAMGYEANQGGTSYLNDPEHMLGSFQAGAAALTLTGDRSVAGGCATVKWDDEGVEPDECVLVKAGVLQDFQTSRESAGWLKDTYARAGRICRSHGFCAAPSAMEPPMLHVPNLAVAPGPDAHRGYAELLAGVADGVAIESAGFDMDFQHSSGLGTGRIFEVKRGKKTARLVEAGFLFRATELWKGLQDLGGEASVRRFGRAESKGAPAQQGYFSASAPPALVKQLALINPLRKA